MLKIAVIGCGYWGPNLIRNFRELNDVEVVSVCDLDEKKLDRLRNLYPRLNTTLNYRDILNDKEVEAVCIATPPSTHYEIAKSALLSEKHVLVEKPITQTSKEAEELIEIAEAKNKILMVDHTFVYTGAVRKIKELIDNGELGKLFYFSSERVNLGILHSDASVIEDLAVHDISIIDYLFGQKPETVSAVGSSHILNNGREEMAHITIKHQQGLVSHILVSWLSPVKIRKIIVGGGKKMVLFDDVEPTEKIKIYDKGIEIDPDSITPFNPLYRGGDVLIPKIDQTEALKRMAEHFVFCIQNKEKPLTDGRAGQRAVKILEAIQKSLAQNSQLINVSE